jgi:hypothetical protein
MIIGNLINVSNEDLTLFFTGVVALSTVVYAILTWKLVSETQKMREAQTEPKVSVFVETHPKYYLLKNLVIRNIGLGTAYNIQFIVSPDFKTFNSGLLSEMNIIMNGIPHLPPNSNYEFLLANIRNDFRDPDSVFFKIIANYQNSFGKKFSDTFEIDMRIWYDLATRPDDELKEIERQLKDINGWLHQIANNIENSSE